MRGLAVVLVLAALLQTSPGSAAAAPHDRILELLDRVEVTATAPYYPGYDRDCDPGGCVFGEEWTDDNTTRFGHNGCDTRQDVLLQQMHHIELRWGSKCRIYQARLRDPYTGRRLTWRRDGYRIQVDHVYPLSRAWYAGAWAWSQQERVGFANDVDRELVATWGAANQAKENLTPADWLPPRQAYHCRYVLTYLKVAVHYGLSVTEADAATISGRRRAGAEAATALATQRLGDALEVAAHDGPLGLVQRRVDLGEPGLHAARAGRRPPRDRCSDLDLGAPAVVGMRSALDVPAGGQPVDHAGRRGGGDAEQVGQLDRSTGAVEQVTQGLELGGAQAGAARDRRLDGRGHLDQLV